MSTSAQAPSGIFLKDAYKDVYRTSDVPYGANFTEVGILQTLLLDVYEPRISVDYRRPLIIFFHSGDFMSGDKLDDKGQAFGNYFGTHGYVVASANYRLGKDTIGIHSDDFRNAYRSVQDAKAAIRYFKKYSDDYCIDTSEIFLAGASSGAITVLLSAYWQQDEANTVVNSTSLGSLENSGGNEGYSTKISGIISCWGGLPDTTILQGETTPVYFFHGTNDGTIPYTQGISNDNLLIFGSYVLHRVATEYGVESFLKPFTGANHGFYATSPRMDTLLDLANGFLYQLLHDKNANQSCNRFALQLFPNPTEGNIIIKNPDQLLSFDGSLDVFDLTGRRIFSSPVAIHAQSTLQLNLPHLANGYYVVRCKNIFYSRVFKLLVGSDE